jgi:hypothetical protein
VKQVGVDLMDLAKAYSQAGDPASAPAAFPMAMNLGQRYASVSTDPMLIRQLVGMAIEKIARTAMDPIVRSVTTARRFSPTRPTHPEPDCHHRIGATGSTVPANDADQDILNYENRRRAFGAISALQWVVNTYGPQ